MSVVDNADRRARTEAHRAKQLHKRLFQVLWINTPGTTREQHLEVLPDHLDFLMELERRGVLFASGPLAAAEGGSPAFNGMTILRGSSFEEVRSLIEGEPFVRAGLRSYHLHSWDLNEGSFTVRLSFGTGTYEVP